MRIAFHAPLKAPDHATPSGDRQMARQLVKALERAGHQVAVATGFTSFEPTGAAAAQEAVAKDAAAEIERIAGDWRRNGAPQLWLAYHSYYKAPDRIGPALCRTFHIPYVTAEASYAAKRDDGPFAAAQAVVRDGLALGVAHFCFTPDDREGLAQIVAPERLVALAPFIDIARLDHDAARAQRAETRRRLGLAPDMPVIIAVGMMRGGDKLMSYRTLAAALARLRDRRFAVLIVGDGRERAAVEEAFSVLPPERVHMAGAAAPAEMAGWYAAADIHAWPGHGEAYGLAYLEAQAMGLPVVAQRIRGVPSVVRDGETALLTAPGDDDAYVAALAALLDDPARRRAMGAAARRFVTGERTLEHAAARIGATIDRLGVPA